MEMIEELKPESVSIAIKEFIPETSNEIDIKIFLKDMLYEKIIPQYVVYSAEELERFYNLKAKGVIPGKKQFVLFVLGKYDVSRDSSPKDLLPFIHTYKKHASDNSVQWAVCAFGKAEASCMLTAAMLGGHVRIGFENNIHLQNGIVAENNAALVKQFCALYPAVKRKIATTMQTKELIY